MSKTDPRIAASDRSTPVESSRDPDRSPTDGLVSERVGRDDHESAAASVDELLPSTDVAGGLDLDTAFDVVKNRRRRRVVAYLLEEGGQTSLSDLAEHLAAIENDKAEVMLSSQERKRVYIGLYQCHLPRMDAAGVIEFDRHRGTIEASDGVSALEPFVAEFEPSGTTPTPSLAPSGRAVLAGAVVVGLGLLVPGVPDRVAEGLLLAMLAGVVLFAAAGLLQSPGGATEIPAADSTRP